MANWLCQRLRLTSKGIGLWAPCLARVGDRWEPFPIRNRQWWARLRFPGFHCVPLVRDAEWRLSQRGNTESCGYRVDGPSDAVREPQGVSVVPERERQTAHSPPSAECTAPLLALPHPLQSTSTYANRCEMNAKAFTSHKAAQGSLGFPSSGFPCCGCSVGVCGMEEGRNIRR